MPAPRRYSLLLCSIVLLVVSALSVQAQQAPKDKSQSAGNKQIDQEPIQTFKAETRLVVVDVIATDKQGDPVTDLTVDDFEIFDNYKEQKLRTFDKFPEALEREISPPLVVKAHELPLNTFSNIPTFKTNKPLTVVLFDSLDTSLANHLYARKQMLKLLETMPADQPIAVYSLSAGVNLILDFTTDREALKKVVRELKDDQTTRSRFTEGGSEPKSGATPISPTGGLFPSGGIQGLLDAMLVQIDEDYMELDQEIRCVYLNVGLQNLARRLSGLPGRKKLIWVADFFPFDPNLTTSVCKSVDSSRTSELLANAQVAVYPLTAAGLETAGLKAADAQVLRNPFLQQISAIRDNIDRMNIIAERTGGLAYYNRNDIDVGMSRDIGDGNTYYTLGFYPDKKLWDGGFRRVQVKVKRRNVMLRYRYGYIAREFSSLSAKKKANDFAAALEPETPVSTSLLFKTQIRMPSAETRGKVELNYAIDSTRLWFRMNDTGQQSAQVDCAAIVYTEEKKLVLKDVATVESALQPEGFDRVRREGFPCTQSLDLAAGTYLLRLGVRDSRNGLIGTANARITVP